MAQITCFWDIQINLSISDYLLALCCRLQIEVSYSSCTHERSKTKWTRPYLLCSFLENKCSGKGTYALVGKKKKCVLLSPLDLLGTPQQNAESAVLCFCCWCDNSKFLLKTSGTTEVILLGFWNTATNHFIFKLELTVTTLHFENISSFLWELIVKHYLLLTTAYNSSFYEINYISLLPVSSIYSPSTRGPKFFNRSFLVHSCHRPNICS